MPRNRIDLAAVVQVAISLVDADGLDALTLSNVAEELEVRPSALYTHVEGTKHLHYVVAVAATSNLTATIRDAAIGVAGHDAVMSVAQAYHGFASDHPGQYAATLAPPFTEDDRLASACADLLDVLTLVLRGLGLSEEGSAAAAVSMRSTLHGFLALGTAGGVNGGGDAEREQFDQLVDLLISGMAPR